MRFNRNIRHSLSHGLKKNACIGDAAVQSVIKVDSPRSVLSPTQRIDTDHHLHAMRERTPYIFISLRKMHLKQGE